VFWIQLDLEDLEVAVWKINKKLPVILVKSSSMDLFLLSVLTMVFSFTVSSLYFSLYSLLVSETKIL
jgi:hypothetical protein